jgi:hypothetical protein
MHTEYSPPSHGSPLDAGSGFSYRLAVLKRRGLINFLIVLTLLVVFMVGCSVLLRSGGGDDVDVAGDGAGNGGDAATMTFAQFESVPLDQTPEQVEADFGPPTPRQEVIDLGIITDDETTRDCIYYKADPPTFGEWFEFCFENNRLRNKTSL